MGEYTVVMSESLEPGSNFPNLGNFSSISASVQQKTSRLGRSLSGEHTALRHLKIMFWDCNLNSTKDNFVVVEFFPLSIGTVSDAEIACGGQCVSCETWQNERRVEPSLPL